MSHYKVEVTTGDFDWARTDANVFLTMFDEEGNESSELKFNKNLVRGSKEIFDGPEVGTDFGSPSVIKIRRSEGCFFDNWYCEKITVKVDNSDLSYIFPIDRWITKTRELKFTVNNTSLPQEDSQKEQRVWELNKQKKKYEYMEKWNGSPVKIKQLPAEDEFAFMRKVRLGLSVVGDTVKNFLLRIMKKVVGLYSTFQRQDLYKLGYPTPKSISHYTEDEWFAARKLAGTNPNEIRLCNEIPDKFQVNDEMVKEFLEGKSLADAAKSNKLFIIDHEDLAGIIKDCECLAPMALFYLNNEQQLMPIAIQLQQEPGSQNPVFLPNDPKNVWMLAKMWFNLAESTVHQSASHLGFTHLLMEGFCINTHRNVSKSHPVYKLLAPHFLYLMAINELAIDKLLSKDGWVENSMQCGVKGMKQLIAKRFQKYRFNIDGCFPEEIKDRGVDKKEVLPEYPYRDDGLLVYHAIERYVKSILENYYDSPAKLSNDDEIQSWGQDLVTPIPHGLGLKEIPGKFEKVAELSKVLTNVIFTCSAQHAAVNFLQYEEYAFPHNFPTRLTGTLPKDKAILSDEDLDKILPDTNCTLAVMEITQILSEKTTRSLGEYELRYQYDKKSMEAEDKFRKELGKISDTIKGRNYQRSEYLKYEVLDPKNIPNSISI